MVKSHNMSPLYILFRFYSFEAIQWNRKKSKKSVTFLKRVGGLENAKLYFFNIRATWSGLMSSWPPRRAVTEAETTSRTTRTRRRMRTGPGGLPVPIASFKGLPGI